MTSHVCYDSAGKEFRRYSFKIMSEGEPMDQHEAGQRLHRYTLQLMEKTGEKDYAQAFRQVAVDHPDLLENYADVQTTSRNHEDGEGAHQYVDGPDISREADERIQAFMRQHNVDYGTAMDRLIQAGDPTVRAYAES